MSDLIETAVNWDHDNGEVFISTRKRSVVTKLHKLGLKPINKDDPHGYVNFLAKDSDIGVSFRRRTTRKMTDKQAESLRRAREARG